MGDPDAMEMLISEIEDFVFAFAETHIANKADAEDVAMEALGAIWERLPKSLPISKFDDWMSMIVWHKINDCLRARYREAEMIASDIVRDEEGRCSGGTAMGYGPEARRETEEAERAFRGKS